MFSYWEQQSFSYYNHIVAGAGIVGLSTAIELKEQYPNERVLVLERGLLPTGASTRNAGFACMGSVTELLADLRTMGEAEIVQLFSDRKKGLQILRDRLGDDRIGYKAHGSFELLGIKELHALDKITYLNNLLRPVVNTDAFAETNTLIHTFGFSGSYTKGLIKNNCEGELHTGKMMRALTDNAIATGVEIRTGAQVIRFEEEENEVNVLVKDPFRDEMQRLNCSTFSICTNAFTKLLLPQADVVPGRGQVLITEPIEGLFKGIFHFDEGYYYFREIDGRILLGGGRNTDTETETTTTIALNDKIQNDLEQKLREVIIPGRPFNIANRWAGIMAFGADKQPIIKAYSDKIFGAFRMGGMGVALGSYAAAQLVNMIHRTR